MTRARDVAGFISSVNAAGKNFLINGGFDHFQRGTSVTRLTSGQWLADRWTPALFQSGRHQRINLGYVNSELSSPYALRVSSESVAENAGGSRMKAAQTIESINALPLAGKRVTLSFWVRFSSATFTSVANLAGGGNNTYSNFGAYIGYMTSTTDGATTSTFPDSSTAMNIPNGSLPTTWTKYTVTGTVPTTAKNVAVVFEFGTLGSTAASDTLYYDLAQVQLEIGSVATTFSRAGGTIGGELALCQRYYWRNPLGSTNFYKGFGFGTAFSTTQARCMVNFPVPMRTVPQSVEYGGAVALMDSATGYAVTSMSVDYNVMTHHLAYVNANVASGLTQFRPYFLYTLNDINSYIGFNAEF